MGCAAEVIALDDVRASHQRQALRHQLHERFDQWLNMLESQLPETEPTLAQLSETIWALRQELTGGVAQTIVDHRHQAELCRAHVPCASCECLLPARPAAPRTVSTLVGDIELERPYFYCRSCRQGAYPLDNVLGLHAGRIQLDLQQAAVDLVTEVSYETASTLFGRLSGIPVSSERLHTFTHQVAAGLSVLDVAPSRDEIDRRVAQVAMGRLRRPRWRHEWREAKGFRFYLLDGDRIVHVLSWHQAQSEDDLGQALKQVKDAGLIPQESVRLCVIGDGAEWIWKHVQALFPDACQVLDYYPCSEYLHKMAYAQYGHTVHAVQWVEVTLTRLSMGQIGAVLGGLRHMKPTSEEVVKAIDNC